MTFKKILVLFALFSPICLCVSCSSDDSENENLGFNELYDHILSEHISLDSLSRGLNVKKDLLVKARYGIVAFDSNLTDDLAKLKTALDNEDDYDVADILSGDKEYEHKNVSSNITRTDYQTIALARNEEFSNNLPQVVNSHFSTLLNEMVEKNILSFGDFLQIHGDICLILRKKFISHLWMR